MFNRVVRLVERLIAYYLEPIVVQHRERNALRPWVALEMSRGSEYFIILLAIPLGRIGLRKVALQEHIVSKG